MANEIELERPAKEHVNQFATALFSMDYVQYAEFVRYADKAEATIADLRRQLEELSKDCVSTEIRSLRRQLLEAEAKGEAEGIRKAAEAVKQRIGEGLSLPKSVGDKAYAKAGKHCEEAVLSLLPKPTDPGGGK